MYCSRTPIASRLSVGLGGDRHNARGSRAQHKGEGVRRVQGQCCDGPRGRRARCTGATGAQGAGNRPPLWSVESGSRVEGRATAGTGLEL
jgi:hypothetical protein